MPASPTPKTKPKEDFLFVKHLSVYSNKEFEAAFYGLSQEHNESREPDSDDKPTIGNKARIIGIMLGLNDEAFQKHVSEDIERVIENHYKTTDEYMKDLYLFFNTYVWAECVPDVTYKDMHIAMFGFPYFDHLEKKQSS